MFNVQTLQDYLREAAKARLRRMCAVHKSKKGLNVPEWVRTEWATRDQSTMAQLLMRSNWNKALCLC